MSSNRIRFFKMLLSLSFGRGLVALRQILLVPLFLNYWDQEYYGEFLLVSAIPSFLAMTNLGLGTAASTQIALYVADRQIEPARVISATSAIFLAVIALLVSLLTFSMCFFLDFGMFSHLENARFLIPCLVVALFPRIIASVFNGWWTGIKLPAAGYNWYNLLTMCEILTTVVLLVSKCNASQLALALAVVSGIWLFIYILATSFVVRKKLDAAIIAICFDFAKIRSLIFTGLGFQLAPLWQAIYFQGTLIIIGLVIGANGVALWSAIRIFTRFGIQIGDVVIQSFVPEMQLAFGRRDNESLISVFHKAYLSNLALAVATCSAMAIVGRPIFEYWTNQKFEIASILWYLSVLAGFANAIWCLDANFLYLINKPWRLNLVAVGAAVFSLFFIYLFAAQLGMASCALAALIFDFSLCVVSNKLRKDEFDQIHCLSAGGTLISGAMR